MRLLSRRLPSGLLALALLVLPSALRAQTLELIAADDGGVTLRVTTGAPEIGEVAPNGGSLLRGTGRVYDLPGRPKLPYASGLIALPQGATATARVIESSPEVETADWTLAIGEQPSFSQEPGRKDYAPGREVVPPILDGVWPPAPVELGTPFTLRRQRIVAITANPHRYDAATRRLSSRGRMTIRVDFSRPAGAATRTLGRAREDAHWEPVLREGLLNYEQGRTWRDEPKRAQPTPLGRATPAGIAGTFDDGFPEVRVRIDTTGVHSLSYPDLQAQGYPANVPIASVSVHRHEFIEGSIPPYTAIELPIEVVDLDQDGFFGGDDYIIVWVRNWAERSGASRAQRHWGDAEVVYATRVAGAGLRVPQRAGWLGATGLTPLASFPWTRRFERTFSGTGFPLDTLADEFTWTSEQNYYSRPDSIRFEINDIDTTHQASFTVAFLGYANSNHTTWAQIRGSGADPFFSIADSVIWFGRIHRTMSQPAFPASVFREGPDNRLRTWGKPFLGAPSPGNNQIDFAGLDYFDVGYWRRYRALRSVLRCNSGDASGVYQIQAGGFTNGDVRVYDVTDPNAPVRLTLDPSHITPSGQEFSIEFQDSTGVGQRRQYAVTTYGIPVPPERFSRTRPRTDPLRDITNRADGDYVVVVPDAFVTAVQPLVALRQSQGMSVVVAPLESVNDEFNGGRKSAYSIRRLAKHAFDQWDARFLLLVGDANLDPQQFLLGSSPDLVPTQKIAGPVGIPLGNEIIPSDPWYGCVEAPCVLADAVPDVPSLFVGRLPAASVQHVQDMVAKIVAYENVSADQTWRKRLVLSSDDEYSTVSFFGGGGGSETRYCHQPGERIFRLINEAIGRIVADTAGLRRTEIEPFALSYYLRNEPYVPGSPPDTCRPSPQDTDMRTRAGVTPQLLSSLNQGCLWWNFQGHANSTVLCHEDLWLDLFEEDDSRRLVNDGKPFLFSAFSCHANAFAYSGNASTFGPALGEDLVLLPLRGAIASWASSGYEILPGIDTDHINTEWSRRMFWKPPHDEYLGENGARVVLGETIGLALLTYIPTVRFESTERGVGLTYQLLGDPATRLSIGAPQALVTANGTAVESDQPVRLHTPGDTLQIEADLVSTVQLTSITLERVDSTGTVVIPPSEYTITPALPDTAASGLGGRRHHLSYGTDLAPRSYRYVIRTTDRYGVSESFDVVFQFLTQLRLNGAVLADGDAVPPNANEPPNSDLVLRVLSPKPLDPATELTLTINGVVQPFTATAVPGDASGREWDLSWSRAPYPIDQYEVSLQVAGGGTSTHRFRVDISGNELRVDNLLAFPNPFEEDLGTRFSMTLVSGDPVDVRIRVYTISGRMIYEREERALAPGYHQIAWDGRDAEGVHIANGTYLYRLVASNGASKAEQLGRLVKLRKPRRVAETP